MNVRIVKRCSVAFRIPHSATRTTRRSSTVATVFSSFFYHNSHWKSPASWNRQVQRAPHSTDAVLPRSETSSSQLAPYRPAELPTPRRLLRLYFQLSKSRLTILNVLVAMSGVALSPLPTTVPVLLATAIGTAFCSAAANTLNQMQEVPYDAQMARTRNRPLVRRAITPAHAAGFALATGAAGPALLWTMVNPTTALLGAGNIVLYAWAYTWMKRRTVWNTWVGSVVGAIPPLMGWTACGGVLLPSSAHPIQLYLPSFISELPSMPLDLTLINNPLPAFALFMLLFSWQFPHFNSLSFIVRGSYAQAGYPMLSVVSPAKNSLVALRHSLLLIPICSILFPISGLVTWTFALTSLVPNAICVRAAWQFWKVGGEKEARTMWQHYLWYLPVVLGMLMVHKQGVDWLEWMGVSRSSDAGHEQDEKPYL